MRNLLALALLLGACLGACTKTNPNLCCTDEADCTSKGIPTDSICSGGLICRGNQCIAETCHRERSARPELRSAGLLVCALLLAQVIRSVPGSPGV